MDRNAREVCRPGGSDLNARFPRLAISKAAAIVERRGLIPLRELEQLEMPALEHEQFAPTGPARVTEGYLQSLRVGLDAIATDVGYPNRFDNAFRDFDRASSVYLAELDMPIGQAIRSDTWAWMAVYLAPHLVHWRWGTERKVASQARYAGILQRNALGRLWFRAHVMREADESKWSTLDLINEDAHVAILERSSVSRDHRLARAIVRRWHASGGGESALRSAMIRIRMQLLLQEFAELPDADLEMMIDGAFPARATSTFQEALTSGPPI